MKQIKLIIHLFTWNIIPEKQVGPYNPEYGSSPREYKFLCFDLQIYKK